jgi:ABC-type multidrug transport system ATPase subunit
MIVSIKHLSKEYGKKKALDDVSFSLENGIYGLLGPNGAGKTTLLNIIAGILKPTAGDVYYNGNSIFDLREQFRKILGFLPQSPVLYKSFRAEDFLKYMMVLKGMNLSKKEIQRKADAALSIVNLRDEGRMRIGEYSGGMRQRLGIAQALLNNPKLILLDEPTAGLDPQERVRLRNIITEIAAKRTVIWSTHIVSDIESISSEILMLQNGKLIAKKTPEELTKGIAGKVFEIVRPESGIQKQEPDLLIGNIQRHGKDLMYRVVADRNPGGKEVEPTLEDVYLYYFMEIPSDMEHNY